MTTERSILFSGPMVRSILEDRKTQTRRVAKYNAPLGYPADWCPKIETADFKKIAGNYRKYCPYGQPGDRLWVRENWAVRRDQDNVPIRCITPTTPYFPADGETPSGCGGGMGKTRPSIHMPRWASRITLEVTDVRVQRLNEINEDDAKAEGVQAPHPSEGIGNATRTSPLASERFRTLWDSINAKRGFSWDVNPWVWAISFKRVKP